MSNFKTIKAELKGELFNILTYWKTNTLDHKYGGFVGRITNDNDIITESPKGVILNLRILWSFSKASNYLNTDEYLDICDRSFMFLKNYFNDPVNKGLYWELDYKGNPINKRKQIFTQALGIYALTEYFVLTQKEEAKQWAIELFELIEHYARDKERKGYFEAFDENWHTIKDMRLSEKDMNASKTMNTHLHVLEAYTILLKIYPNKELKIALTELVELFLNTFLNNNNHYNMFYDDNWNLLSNSVSYGHDIETAWLVIEASKVLQDQKLLSQANVVALKVADTFLKEALDEEGAVITEKNLTTNIVDTDRYWWPQVEALIGLRYAFLLTNNSKYSKASFRIWEFIKSHILDTKNGEWFSKVDNKGNVYNEDKVNMWKAPYHNTRACILLNEN